MLAKVCWTSKSNAKSRSHSASLNSLDESVKPLGGRKLKSSSRLTSLSELSKKCCKQSKNSIFWGKKALERGERKRGKFLELHVVREVIERDCKFCWSIYMMQVPELPVVTLKHVHRTRIGISSSGSLFRHANMTRRVASSVTHRRLIIVGFCAWVGTEKVTRMFDRNSICWCVTKLISWTDACVGLGAFVCLMIFWSTRCSARNQSCLLAR